MQMPPGQLERVVSGGSEGSGGQLARTSSHYMGPVGSEALTQHWVQHGWGDTGHVMNRQVPAGSLSVVPHAGITTCSVVSTISWVPLQCTTRPYVSSGTFDMPFPRDAC